MRTLLVVLVTLASSAWSAARADDGVDRGGQIETDEANIEIVRPHHGRVIQTPEGFLRVEDGPDLDRSPGLGSFGTYHPTSAANAPEAGPGSTGSGAADPSERVQVRPDGMVDTTAPVPGTDPCRPQRGRYLRRLLEMSGVKVDRPLDLLDGLAGPSAAGGNVLVSGWVAPGVDPLKPLAWDQELRSLGRDLAACQSRAAAARP